MKTEIIICMGSSCFARGNKKTVSIIQDFLRKNNLYDQVFLKGNHCFGKCNAGPIIKINDKIYEGVTNEKIIEILETELIINNSSN